MRRILGADMEISQVNIDQPTLFRTTSHLRLLCASRRQVSDATKLRRHSPDSNLSSHRAQTRLEREHPTPEGRQ